MVDKDKVETHSWSMDKEKQKVKCFTSDKANQHLSSLAHASRLTDFHDEAVEAATAEINAITEELRRRNRDRTRDLAFIRVPNGVMLAWTGHAVSSFDDPDTIREALGIAPKRNREG